MFSATQWLMNNIDYDVVIVGAGPAGSALAIELASAGLKILLADAAKFPRDKPCGDYVSPKGLKRLKELGCSEQIEALGLTPIKSSRLYLNRDLLVSGDLPSIDGVPAYGLAIPRKILDNILFQRAIECGTETREEFRVKAFHQHGIETIVEGISKGVAEKITTRLLVGADGANSTVAKLCGMQSRDPRYRLASLRAYVHGLSLPHTLMFFDERFFPGYGWIFPVREGLCNIGVGMVKEPLVRDGIKLTAFYEQFKLLVARLAAARNEQIEIETHQGFPISSYGGASKNYFKGGLLVGEAGGFVDPINGEGIPLAFDSAKLAAQTIRHAFDVGDLSEQGLSLYEKSWREFFDPDLGISDLVVSLIRNRALQPLWLSMFRTMSLTANNDKKYADLTGGILGGVVSARDALTPEMFVRALVHRPEFWRKVHGLDKPFDIASLLNQGKDWVSWQANFTRQLFGSDSYTRDWVREISTKQSAVIFNRVGGVAEPLRNFQFLG